MVPRADAAVRAREARVLQSARVDLLSHPAVSSAVVPSAAAPQSTLSEVVSASAAKLEAARPLLRSLFDDLVKRNGVRAGGELSPAVLSGNVAQVLAKRSKPSNTGRALRSLGGGRLVRSDATAEVKRSDLEALAERWPVGRSAADTPSARAVEAEMRLGRESRELHLGPGLVPSVEGGRRLRSVTAKQKEDEEEIRRVHKDDVRGVRGPVAAAMVRAHVAADRVVGATAERKGRRKGPGVSAIEVGVLENGIRERKEVSRGCKRGTGASSCCFCPDPALFRGVELQSELLGPFVNPRGQSKLNVHFECACWAPQVYVDAKTSRFQHVYDEYMRGRHLRCAGCSGRGATVGCYVEKCKKTFHLRCLANAGARKVEKYFVAFCATHRHLVETKSYQLMMEAGSIADVASVIGRDSTQGLDTPHSKHTQLRRGQTEVVFSARARLSSHAGAFDAVRVVYATRRREIIPHSQRLLVKDRPRRIRASALDVVSGRLALLDAEARVAASNDIIEDSETEVAAMLRADKLSPLFLLRNLENAPDWSPEEINVVKVGNGKKTPSKRPSSSARDQSSTAKKRRLDIGAPVSFNNNENGSEEGVPDNGRRSVPLSGLKSDDGVGILGKRLRGPGIPMEGLHDGNIADNDAVEKAQSAVLRLALKEEGMAFVGERRLVKEKEELAQKERREIQIRKTRERDERAARRQEKEAALRRKREAEQAIFLEDEQDGPPARPPIIRTAWQLFLDEQLPKERALRPDDDPKVSMRNMARLWGLLEPLERAVYEEKTKVMRLGLSSFGNTSESRGADTVAAAEAVAQAAAEATQKIRRAPLTSRLANRADAPTGVTQKGASEPKVHLSARMSTRRSKAFEGPKVTVPVPARTPSKGFLPRRRSARHRLDPKRPDSGEDGEGDDEEEDGESHLEVGFFAKHPSQSDRPRTAKAMPQRPIASVSLPGREKRWRKSARLAREDLDSIFPDALPGEDVGKASSSVKAPPRRRQSSRGH